MDLRIRARRRLLRWARGDPNPFLEVICRRDPQAAPRAVCPPLSPRRRALPQVTSPRRLITCWRRAPPRGEGRGGGREHTRVGREARPVPAHSVGGQPPRLRYLATNHRSWETLPPPLNHRRPGGRTGTCARREGGTPRTCTFGRRSAASPSLPCHQPSFMGNPAPPAKPPSTEYGTRKTDTANFWPWLSDESPYTLEDVLFARKHPQGKAGGADGNMRA